MTKDDMLSTIKEVLPSMVQSAVKEVLGIKDAAAQIDGGVIDTAGKDEVAERDYSSFLV